MRKLHDHKYLPVSHIRFAGHSSGAATAVAGNMVDTILEELSEMDIDLNTISLNEMKQLFAEACRGM